MFKTFIAVLAFGAAASAASAQDTAQGDPSQGTGPLPPNVAPAPTPICTDRPTKATVACTVPKGAFQIETDIASWTRESADGTRTDTILYTNPTLKYGITKRTDIEVNIAPWETVATRTGTQTDRIGGVGDLYLRVKQRLTTDTSKTQVSLIPFVKAPTARTGIGNGRWEGGVAAAVNIPLPQHITLSVGSEVDVLADQAGSGYHAGIIGFINISHSLLKDVNVFAELWSNQEFDPAGTRHQYSVDVAAAWQLTTALQFDAGANIGLNDDTPRHQLYVGVSTRF